MDVGAWIAALLGATGLTVWFTDRLLRPLRARWLAEAEEKRAIAVMSSDEMRSALRVLTGDDGDPRQGIPPTRSLGQRVAGMEASLSRVEEQLNGGGLGSALSQLDAKVTEHIETAEGTRDDVQAEIRQTRRELGKAVTTLTTSHQRLEERVDDLHGKVTGELHDTREANDYLRAALTEALLVDEERNEA